MARSWVKAILAEMLQQISQAVLQELDVAMLTLQERQLVLIYLFPLVRILVVSQS
jgi:hypothetical protein